VSTIDAVIATDQVDEPIRAELFGTERLEQHAESLAAAQRTTEKPAKGKNLLPRVHENRHALLGAYRNIVEAVREKREITPASEWLLDNFFVVDEQLRDCCRRSPKATSPDTLASMRWPGPTWPTPTAGSTRRRCSDSSAPTSASSRSPSERSGL
jgi:hypothetical protein